MKNIGVIIKVLVVIALLSVIGIPVLINELYKGQTFYITEWGASEILMYFGSILSFIGTIVLGFVAYMQNKKITDINERSLLNDEENNYPYIKVSLERTSNNPIQQFITK